MATRARGGDSGDTDGGQQGQDQDAELSREPDLDTVDLADEKSRPRTRKARSHPYSQ